MICYMLRRRKKSNSDGLVSTSFNIPTDESKYNQKSYSSNWFSHYVNLTSKDFNYVFSLIDKCLKLCIQPDINFKTNPPYLPSILRNFNNKITSIQKCYEHNLSELSDIYFFRVSILTLLKQCKEILRIFRKGKSTVCDELSLPRQKLIEISFLLSHLYHALIALFPNSYYAPETFRITKSDAAEWWHSHFGLSTTIVKWKDFFHVFSKINYLSDISHIAALKRTINITGSGFVSIFDFDVFVRLFQPWNSIMDSWKIIVLEHPGCMLILTYEQVVQILKSFKYYPGPGSYIFRLSCTKPGQWAIGYVDVSGKIFQTIVHNKSLATALCEGEHAGIYKFPNGKFFDSESIRSLHTLPPENIIVNQEEYEAYCRIDSSFEVCKICDLNNKNIRLEPCGHLLCDFCLTRWQKSFRSQGCPFCRFEIKGVERVSLVPYKSENIPTCQLNCPAIPARLDIKDSTMKLNYAMLEWQSHNDGSICPYSNYVEQMLTDDGLYQNTTNKHNMDDSMASTSTSEQDSLHITSHRPDAMIQLLKITNNDIEMSREILRHFTLRSVVVTR